jgi:hypothetical protein
LKKIDVVLAWVMILLGILHCGAAWITIRGFPVGALWGFAGGTALIEGGLLNVVRQGGGKGMTGFASITANILLAVLVLSVGWSQFSHLLRHPSFLVTAVVVIAELLFSVKGN